MGVWGKEWIAYFVCNLFSQELANSNGSCLKRVSANKGIMAMPKYQNKCLNATKHFGLLFAFPDS